MYRRKGVRRDIVRGGVVCLSERCGTRILATLSWAAAQYSDFGGPKKSPGDNVEITHAGPRFSELPNSLRTSRLWQECWSEWRRPRRSLTVHEAAFFMDMSWRDFAKKYVSPEQTQRGDKGYRISRLELRLETVNGLPRRRRCSGIQRF
jgi:hypothetical protein